MRSLSLLALLSLFVHTANAAIQCEGIRANNPKESVIVRVDGNPLVIFYKIPSNNNGGLTMLVNVLETAVIMGDSEGSVERGTYTRGELHMDLKLTDENNQRYNAKLVTRDMSSTSVFAKKEEYLLSCKGKVPKVYLEEMQAAKPQ